MYGVTFVLWERASPASESKDPPKDQQSLPGGDPSTPRTFSPLRSG
jgi:hypothetical protein